MKFSQVAGAVVATAASAIAKEIKPDLERAAALFDNGLQHSKIMQHKMSHWQAEIAAGMMDSAQYPRLNYTKCVNGVAEAIPGDPLHTFRCKNADLYDFLPHADIGSPLSTDGEVGSSSWGWTSPDGREFVAAGLFQGTSFIEILPTGKMLFVAFLPSSATDPSSGDNLWREIRGYRDYMLIGSEARGHGVQIFDMRKVAAVTAEEMPKQFSFDDMTGHFTGLPIGATHNVVANSEVGYGVAVGARPRTDKCAAGLIFYDLADPSNPVSLGCYGGDGYVHDAQCLIYRGPHTKYVGRDICYGYNEDTLTIYDVTDKSNVTIISRTGYEGSAYTHQGWVLDVNNQEYLLMDDEYDEYDALNSGLPGPGEDLYPVTYIWDIKDLESPKNTGLYKGTQTGIDHNQYVIDGYSYQSNYMGGLRVYDVSSIPTDPSGSGVCEVAFFDIYPEDDSTPGGGAVDFSGSWSSYAYFKSGYIFVSTIERGVFVVKLTAKPKCKPAGCSADNCLRAMRSEANLAGSQEFCGEFTKTFISDVSVVPEYAAKACTTNVISRVSSACKCLPTA